MKLADLGTSQMLEALLKPSVTGSALFFEVYRTKSPCCTKRCCFVGRAIDCDGIFPSHSGLIIERNSTLLLNNTRIIQSKPQAQELFVEKNGSSTILGWTIPSRVVRAFEHPWGAIVVLQDFVRDDKKYLTVGMLVLPTTT